MKAPKRTPKYRKIDPEKVQMLASRGVPVTEIAKLQGCHHSAISRFLQKLKIDRKTLKEFGEQRALALSSVHAKAVTAQDRLLDTIIAELADEGIMKSLSVHQKTVLMNSLATVGGIAFDKMRLETGASTVNVSLLSKMIDATHETLFNDRKGKNDKAKKQIPDG